jgi:hypothetical protein
LHPLADDWKRLRERVQAFFDQFAHGSVDLLRYVGLLGIGTLASALHAGPWLPFSVVNVHYLAQALVHKGEVVWDLTADTSGLLLGDRNYWLPTLQAALRKVGVILQAPFRKASSQPARSWSPVLGRVRYRIDTVFGQLTDHCGAKRVWAVDLWHLRNRLLRMVLMNTLCVLFNLQDQAPLLQLKRLVA